MRTCVSGTENGKLCIMEEDWMSGDRLYRGLGADKARCSHFQARKQAFVGFLWELNCTGFKFA